MAYTCFQYFYLENGMRAETHFPYLWQYLESQDSILTNVQREAPAGEQNFALSGAKKSKSLKNRALRAPARPLRRPKVEILLLTSKK